ncbi:hypothetical protein HY78_08470 [Rhizorhabdus wittichii DC-6]|nr:hypothetical protein HY78_08470 [Rhizorhabdus wittichii DC-6]
MAENTKIEWAHHTFNPWIGCMKVGPGCDHCYAETLATARLGVAWGAGAPRRRTAESTWKQPRRWNARAAKLGTRYRVFCSSLADVFDNEVDPAWRQDLFELIRTTPHLDWLLLTKRIGNAVGMIQRDGAIAGNGRWYVPDNVWLGATIVNEAEADRDIPKLLATKAELGVRKVFLSMEPLLGPVNLTDMPCGARNAGAHGWSALWREEPFGRGHLDWIIVGGESGPGARPMNPDWARSLRDQCAAAGVPFLFKQWGEWAPAPEIIEASGPSFHRYDDGTWLQRVGKKLAGRLFDGVQHDGVPA